jgi:transposase-like protein
MQKISYARYRFPPVIIQHAVWLYFRFPLSFRDVEGPCHKLAHVIGVDPAKLTG